MNDDRLIVTVNTRNLSPETVQWERGACSDPQPVTEMWRRQDTELLEREKDYLLAANLGFPLRVTAQRDIQQPFQVDSFTFLLTIHHSFPRRTPEQELPIRVYLVLPELRELSGLLGGKRPWDIRCDASGSAYLACEQGRFSLAQEYVRFCAGRTERPLSEKVLFHVRQWVKGIRCAIESHRRKKGRCGTEQPVSRSGVWIEEDPAVYSLTAGRAKYTDGRLSAGCPENRKCRRVVLSDRAYIQIYNESKARIGTETGGLFLGHFENGVWYVIEASDPGINAKFYNAYHEGDDVYENHVCGVISRTYKHPLVFLGMWHRHPGSLDTFSGTDDVTNRKYAVSAGNGCISAIVNYDPDFRLTFYYVEQGRHGDVYYTRVDVEVGDDKIKNKEMMRIATAADVDRRQD